MSSGINKLLSNSVLESLGLLSIIGTEEGDGVEPEDKSLLRLPRGLYDSLSGVLGVSNRRWSLLNPTLVSVFTNKMAVSVLVIALHTAQCNIPNIMSV